MIKSGVGERLHECGGIKSEELCTPVGKQSECPSERLDGGPGRAR